MTDIDALLIERGAVYGDYSDVAATSQALKQTMRQGASYGDLSAAERESLDMIANKLARAVNGKRHRDNFDDIAGYAQLAAKVSP